MSDADFQAEYAKSGRAGCKACRTNIAQGSLRLAIMVQSPMFDGRVPNWFHFACFWKRARVGSEADIYGFNSLRWEDQEKIKEKLGGGGGGAAAAGGKGGKKGAAAAAAGDDSYKDFAAEYAKSNRSTCRGCDNKIEKDEVRLSRKDYDSQRAKMYGPQDLWYHVDCFSMHRDQVEFSTSMDPNLIPGFKFLRKEDKDAVIEKLGKGDKKKRKAEVAAAAPVEAKKAKKESKEETEQREALKEQSKMLWKIRDDLEKQVSNDALKGLLEFNNQEIPSGESRLLDRVSDAMAFGALEPCTECGGQLKLSGSGESYTCSGNLTEWTKCLNSVVTPARRPFKIPKEFKDVDVLKKYKYVKGDRIFPPSNNNNNITDGASSSQASASSSKPLSGMKFSIIGKTQKKKGDLTKMIEELGGKISTTIDSNVLACISSKGEVDKKGKSIKQAESAGVHVIDDGFFDDVSSGGDVAQNIVSHSIASWGADPTEKVKTLREGATSKIFKSLGKSMVTAKDEAMFTKSLPSTLTMTVKGGAAVDPESGLADKSHVLQENKDSLYNAVLGLVDIVRGTNSYYKLQLLEADKGNKVFTDSCGQFTDQYEKEYRIFGKYLLPLKLRYWLYRAWGRVGTTIGGNKVEPFATKQVAVEAFKALYGEKTGNDWKDRKNFVKVAGKFFPLDIDYGGDDEAVGKLDASAGSNSKLPQQVQDLIRMIFDVESMKKAMLEYEIDLKKMPLGKLSKKQIESAFSVLTELQGMIETGGSPTQLLDGSNRFYTLIPHDFGMKKPPLLDTTEIIKTKTEMLNNLLDIEIAYNLIKGGDTSAKDPLDVHYEKLKTDIQVVDKKSELHDRLAQYIKNTHAQTHQQYDLEVLDIFTIDREGEKKVFRPFKELHNRKLLWHGSRTTNFAGILSQGLRIAPPEAPVTGYMFGKGIYFADMVSKSANYCCTSKSNPVGILLLCEVALGNEYECLHSEYITKLPTGKHSTKGCGMTAPDPAGKYMTPEGVEIPMGKGVKAPINQSSLLYNEYIVYDVAQVNIKYLLKVNFKYKW